MKQKTMLVESYPGDGSDGEAVSPSSTKPFEIEAAQAAFFVFILFVDMFQYIKTPTWRFFKKMGISLYVFSGFLLRNFMMRQRFKRKNARKHRIRPVTARKTGLISRVWSYFG